MALMTRVCTPICSRASCNARELMTVASMPMWSAVTRSIFCPAAAKNVAAAHHHTNLNSGASHLSYFVGKLFDPSGVNSKRRRPGHHLSAQFEQNPLESGHNQV